MKTMTVTSQSFAKRAVMVLAVLFTMFAPVTQALAQTYKLGGNYVKFTKQDEAGQYVEATEAAVGDEIIASVNNKQIPQGKYFTGEYSSQDLTLTTNWDGTFIMPAKDVTVNAVLAAQKDYTIDLTTSTTAVIPMEISILLSYLEVGGQTCSVYDNEYNWFLDLNVDGINDVEVKSTFDATTQDYIYSIEQLSGNGVYKTSCSFALNITPPEQYKSLIFNFKEVAPAVTLQSGWITVSGGPFTYTGQAIEPTVTVNDGTTDITGEFNVTYSNNKNAGEATVTVTAKTTSTSYTGSVSKTFTIKPMPVTITADGETKVYDGQPLTKNSYTHTELASDDAIKSVTVTGSQTDAGTSENVPSGAIIQNAANENVTDNYAITYTKGTLTVTKASLNITAESYNGVYDGAAHAITVKNVPEGLTVQYSEDNTNFGSSELKYTNICEKTIYWKVDNDNYDLTSGASGNAQVTITPKAVTISGVKAKDKIYDGTTSAVIDAESAIIDGKVEGDVLTVNAQSVTAVFVDAEAGKDKPVTVSGFTLAGDQAGNYTLSAQPTSVTGTIVPKPVTVESGLTVSSTTLNEITGYSVDATNVEIVGAVNNEKLSIRGVIARLQNGSTVICDLDYTAATIVIGVDKANNYVLAQQGNQATAEITASTETVENADGSTIETATTRVKNADGSITETTQKKVTGDDGSVTEKETTIYANGSIAVRQTTTDAEGHQSCIELSVNDDDSEEVKLTSADAEGSEMTETVSASHSNEDGSTTCTETVTETTKDTGGNVTEKTTATTESTTKTTENSDGSVTDRETVKTTVTDAAGNSRVTEESIRETTTYPDGTTIEDVSGTMELGDISYLLGEEGASEADPDGAEEHEPSSADETYKEIEDDLSGVIQNNTGANINGGNAIITPITVDDIFFEDDDVNDDDDDDDDDDDYNNDVSVLLEAAGAGNVCLNTKEETDAEGVGISLDASITVKQTASAGGSGEASFDSNPSAQIAFSSLKPKSGSKSDSGKKGRLSWSFSKKTETLTITGNGVMGVGSPWKKYKKKISTINIKSGVKSIASNAFKDLTKLEKVNIASSVTSIGSNALKKCKKLKKVNIASGSQLIKIGKGAFSGLKQRLTINLPSSVTRIGENAFNNCHGKTRVYVDVPHGKVLNVKITGVSKPRVIKPNKKGWADITSCLFKKLSNRKSSRALTLHVVDAVDDDDTGDDPDDSGDDGDDSGDDGDDSGSGSDDSGSGGSAIVNGGANKAATTMTINYQTKKATDGGAATADVSGGTRVTAGNKSVATMEGAADRSGSGTRGATAEQEDDEIEIVSGQEYKILRDGYIVLNFYTPDADITVNSIIFRRPGDANNDGYVNAADIVEMINAKDDKASKRFNFINADIDRNGTITQEDIDAVVKYIMETGL